jgi:hypothetical protein
MQDSKTTPTIGDTIERQRSAMVLYEIERAFGGLLEKVAASPQELPKNVVKEIVAREREKKRAINELDVKSIVRATYLQELLDMLHHVFAERVQSPHVARLGTLFKVLGVIDIRNAISHPNRPFPPAYWRRLAAIASDDSIRGLGLMSVIDALAAAESGRLEDPPAEWIALHRWEFPNNVPINVEHQLTGLIGRKKEAVELQNLISNPRLNLIAVVGPGGVGKTALLLDVLVDLVSTPAITRWADRVLYMTAKTERLTVDGVEKIATALASLSDVRARVQQLLVDSTEGDQDIETERLLLCIDNLETLLRDEPTAFEEFYHSLPLNWRVIVTSRVGVNSATVMVLKPLNQGGAETLGRMYAARRGADIQEENLKRLVSDCDRNPLAIRLCIDAFVAGSPLPEATAITRGRVIEFSYQNLIGTLSPQAKMVLECLFVTPEPIDRESACLLLRFSVDEAAEAFRQLSGTALISRKTTSERESYELSALVRELLILYPLNVEARDRVQKELRRDRNREKLLGIHAASTNASPASIQYIPPNSKPYVARMVNSTVDCLKTKSRREQSRVLISIESALDSDPGNVVLARLAGILLLELGDVVKAKEKLALATRGQTFDIYAALELIALYRTDQELELARQVAAKLKAIGAQDLEKVGRVCASRTLREYWVTEIWSGNTDGALEATATWGEAGELRPEMGSIRAQAFKAIVEGCVSAESIGDGNSMTAEAAVEQGLLIWNDLLRSEGYVGRFVDAGWKFLLSTASAISSGLIRNKDTSDRICDFADGHLAEMCSVHRELKLQDPAVQQVLLTFRGLECNGKNPLATEAWSQRAGVTNQVEGRKKVIGGVVAQRYRFPSGELKDFMLVLGDDGQKYFVHQTKVEDHKSVWERIEEGDPVVLEPSRIPQQDSSKHPKAFRVALRERPSST